MENISTTISPPIIKEPRIVRNLRKEELVTEIKKTNPVYEKLAAEGYESFFNYVEWLGLAKNPNLIVLPSSHHYFYDSDDLKGVKTVITVKQLNQITQIKEFLNSIYKVLPDDSYFIGSFIDKERQYNLNISDTSRFSFLNTIYNVIDFWSNRYLTKRTVKLLLEEAGLNVFNMNELNSGLTNFCAYKVHNTTE